MYFSPEFHAILYLKVDKNMYNHVIVILLLCHNQQLITYLHNVPSLASAHPNLDNHPECTSSITHGAL